MRWGYWVIHNCRWYWCMHHIIWCIYTTAWLHLHQKWHINLFIKIIWQPLHRKTSHVHWSCWFRIIKWIIKRQWCRSLRWLIHKLIWTICINIIILIYFIIILAFFLLCIMIRWLFIVTILLNLLLNLHLAMHVIAYIILLHILFMNLI